MSYSIVIPTMWYDLSSLFIMLDKYQSCSLISRVFIINNRKSHTPELPYKKVTLLNQKTNIFVNPAWNLGVQKAKTKNVILANDDIIIDDLDKLMVEIDQHLDQDMVIGVGNSCFQQYGLIEDGLRIESCEKERQNGYGVFMAIQKESYPVIPDELKVWWGDHWIYNILYPFEIRGIEVKTDMRSTSKNLSLSGVTAKEEIHYNKLIQKYKNGTINVALVLRTGGEFNFKDVDLLCHYLRKFTDLPLNIICFTDTVSSEIELEQCTLVPFPNKKWKGWWSKMNLFSPELKKYRPFFYVDLDTAIVRDYTHIIPNKIHRSKFITLSDFYKPEWLASGVMWIPRDNPKVDLIWKEWNKRTAYFIENKWGDQGAIRYIIGDSDLRWQNVSNGITTFKPRNGKLNKPMLLSDVPYHASIICFHGKPRIFEAALKIDWVHKYAKKIWK